MKIEVSGFLELSATLVEHMREMGIDPAGFLRDRMAEAVEYLEMKMANELKILSPCLTSDLYLEVIED